MPTESLTTGSGKRHSDPWGLFLACFIRGHLFMIKLEIQISDLLALEGSLGSPCCYPPLVGVLYFGYLIGSLSKSKSISEKQVRKSGRD